MDATITNSTAPIDDCKKCVNRLKGVTSKYECYWVTVGTPDKVVTAMVGLWSDVVGTVLEGKNNSVCCNYKEVTDEAKNDSRD